MMSYTIKVNTSVEVSLVGRERGLVGWYIPFRDPCALLPLESNWALGLGKRPSAIVSVSQHLIPEKAAPAQGDRRTSLAMDRCAKGEGGAWVNPGGGDRRYSG